MATAFETESCSRCGGSGQHSFNGEHSRCYKCDGKNNGMALTKRGRAAKEFYLAMRNIAVADVKIGDAIKTLNFKKLSVTEISRGTHPWMPKSDRMGFLFTNKDGKSDWIGDNETISLIPSAEQNAVFIAQALAYQETLTKSGTPRKHSLARDKN